MSPIKKYSGTVEHDSLKIVKKVQRLIGRLIALSRFIARLGEQSLPFFKVLRNTPNFQWTPECQKSFKELKVYLSSLNVLSLERERLYYCI